MLCSITQQGDAGTPLTVKGRKLLTLYVSYRCVLDREGKYLAVAESRYEVRILDKTEAILRWDYVKEPRSSIPTSHMHVHAQRDDVIFAMLKAGGTNRRARKRAEGDHVPQFSDLHIPLGGPRYRPCLEDLLEFLIVEFGLDKTPELMGAIREGRKNFRIRQLKAAVRDAPDEAAKMLEDLGYTVDAPAVPQGELGTALTAL